MPVENGPIPRFAQLRLAVRRQQPRPYVNLDAQRRFLRTGGGGISKVHVRHDKDEEREGEAQDPGAHSGAWGGATHSRGTLLAPAVRDLKGRTAELVVYVLSPNDVDIDKFGEQELWEGLPEGKGHYWKSFSPEIKGFVKARLEDRLDEEAFWSAVFSVLGI